MVTNGLLLGRKSPKFNYPFFEFDIGSCSMPDITGVLAEASTVIHLAARVHIMNDSSSDPLFDFRVVNTSGTLSLARQAAAAGVKRFIFLSSIKVSGESTSCRGPHLRRLIKICQKTRMANLSQKLRKVF